MAAPRAFISFQMEDKGAREFLVEQAHQKNNSIVFVDYSFTNPLMRSGKLIAESVLPEQKEPSY